MAFARGTGPPRPALVIVAAHTGPDGDDGFVAATAGKGDIAGRALQVEDLHAGGPAAEAALWRFLLDVDLISEVTAWARPLDERLDLLLADPRDLTVTGVEDELWLRLVDVPAALAARGFADAPPVLLGVHDPFLEANAGVYRIAGGTAERVDPSAARWRRSFRATSARSRWPTSAIAARPNSALPAGGPCTTRARSTGPTRPSPPRPCRGAARCSDHDRGRPAP